MKTKQPAHREPTTGSPQRTPQPAARFTRQTHPAAVLQRARLDPTSLTAQDVLQLQRTIGNQAVSRLLMERIQRQPRPDEKPDEDKRTPTHQENQQQEQPTDVGQDEQIQFVQDLAIYMERYAHSISRGGEIGQTLMNIGREIYNGKTIMQSIENEMERIAQNQLGGTQAFLSVFGLNQESEKEPGPEMFTDIDSGKKFNLGVGNEEKTDSKRFFDINSWERFTDIDSWKKFKLGAGNKEETDFKRFFDFGSKSLFEYYRL